jgi:hypothetical protein
MKTKTNFMEIILRDNLLGKQLFTDNDNSIVITELNFDPLTNHAFIKDENGNGYRLGMMDKFDIDLDIPIEKIEVNKGIFNRKKDKDKKKGLK